MKLFFFLVTGLFVAGTSAQNNSISIDLQRIYNQTDARVDAFVNGFIKELGAAANDGLAVLNNFWTGLSSSLLKWFGVLSPAFASIIDRAINVTAQAFAIDYSAFWLRNATNTNFQNARNIYNAIFQQYIGSNSTAYDVYQCWNASRSQVTQVLATFINSTTTLSRPIIAEFRNVTRKEFNAVIANLTNYQAQVIKQCPVYLFFRVASCRNQFWIDNSQPINAALDRFLFNVQAQRNTTFQALDSIVDNNAEIARNNLQDIRTAIETCVNNTLTTIATTTMATTSEVPTPAPTDAPTEAPTPAPTDAPTDAPTTV